jgi:hypothetical protein
MILHWHLPRNDSDYLKILNSLNAVAWKFLSELQASALFFTYKSEIIALVTVRLAFASMNVPLLSPSRMDISAYILPDCHLGTVEEAFVQIRDFVLEKNLMNQISGRPPMLSDSIMSNWFIIPIERPVCCERMCPPPPEDLMVEIAGPKCTFNSMWVEHKPTLPPPPLSLLDHCKHRKRRNPEDRGLSHEISDRHLMGHESTDRLTHSKSKSNKNKSKHGRNAAIVRNQDSAPKTDDEIKLSQPMEGRGKDQRILLKSASVPLKGAPPARSGETSRRTGRENGEQRESAGRDKPDRAASERYPSSREPSAIGERDERYSPSKEQWTQRERGDRELIGKGERFLRDERERSIVYNTSSYGDDRYPQTREGRAGRERNGRHTLERIEDVLRERELIAVRENGGDRLIPASTTPPMTYADSRSVVGDYGKSLITSV